MHQQRKHNSNCCMCGSCLRAHVKTLLSTHIYTVFQHTSRDFTRQGSTRLRTFVYTCKLGLCKALLATFRSTRKTEGSVVTCPVSKSILVGGPFRPFSICTAHKTTPPQILKQSMFNALNRNYPRPTLRQPCTARLLNARDSYESPLR